MKIWLLLIFALAGCVQTVNPGLTGRFEGVIYENAPSTPLMNIVVQSQVVSKSSTDYTFTGTAILDGVTYQLSGRESGMALRYQTTPSHGSAQAKLFLGNELKYCLSLWVEYSSSIYFSGSLFKASAQTSECTTQISDRVGSVQAERK